MVISIVRGMGSGVIFAGLEYAKKNVLAPAEIFILKSLSKMVMEEVRVLQAIILQIIIWEARVVLAF